MGGRRLVGRIFHFFLSKVRHILQIEDIHRKASQIPPLLSLVRLRPNGAEIPAQILPPPPIEVASVIDGRGSRTLAVGL